MFMEMKKILVIAIALLALTVGSCGNKNKKQEEAKTAAELLQTATEQPQTTLSIEQIADSFAEKIFLALEADDYGQLATIGNEMGEYINGLTEDQGEIFGQNFATSFYAYSDQYGYGQEFATEFLQAMVEELEQ